MILATCYKCVYSFYHNAIGLYIIIYDTMLYNVMTYMLKMCQMKKIIGIVKQRLQNVHVQNKVHVDEFVT